MLSTHNNKRENYKSILVRSNIYKNIRNTQIFLLIFQVSLIKLQLFYYYNSTLQMGTHVVAISLFIFCYPVVVLQIFKSFLLSKYEFSNLKFKLFLVYILLVKRFFYFVCVLWCSHQYLISLIVQIKCLVGYKTLCW